MSHDEPPARVGEGEQLNRRTVEQARGLRAREAGHVPSCDLLKKGTFGHSGTFGDIWDIEVSVSEGSAASPQELRHGANLGLVTPVLVL